MHPRTLRRHSLASSEHFFPYAYDAAGRRTRATLGGTPRHYLVAAPFGDGLESPQLASDGAGNAVAAWVYAGEQPLLRIDPATGEAVYYLEDAMGSVLALADDAGARTARFAYDALTAGWHPVQRETGGQWLFLRQQIGKAGSHRPGSAGFPIVRLPTRLKKSGPKSDLVEEIKLGARTMIDKYTRSQGRRGQLNSIVNHARDYSYSRVVFFVTWYKPSAGEARELARILATRRVLIVVASLSNRVQH